MRQRTQLILSLLLSFALGGAALASPPQPNNRAAEQLKKERISGMVESVQGEKATIRTGRGDRVQVNLGPQAYWREHGYRLTPGRQVTVEGWRGDDDDRGPFFAGGIWGPDFYFELTNGNGFPMWADQDDYWDGWYPTADYYDHYYCGPAPYAYGPPPPYWYGTPPPRWWWGRHHFYGRPGFRFGWRHFDGPYGGPPRGGWHNDRRDDRHGDRDRDRDHRGGWQGDGRDDNHRDQRGGERRH
ncbi:MAG TPA: hypothetical protein VGL38_09065 [bacterium]|jgi:hypothetical protein